MQSIILLRGVNVGGRVIKMAELKECFEKNGYKKVQTILQTGNVIIESPEKNSDKLKKKIESQLTEAFHYSAKVWVLSPEKMEAHIEQYPFGNFGTEYHRYIIFTSNGSEKELVKNSPPLDDKMEAIQAGDGVMYWRVLKGNTLDSIFGKYLGKVSVKDFTTTRNMNTLEKILAKCG
jgi:uncharacterized protein (DUF1697 family)